MDLNRLCSDIETRIKRGRQIVVAIDGMAAAGKSSLAAFLAHKYSCAVVHTDCFFLRPEQRTPERLSETGGNIDYERFAEEVLKPLAFGENFSYRPFNCTTLDFDDAVDVDFSSLVIVEGSYSMHPRFRDLSEELQQHKSKYLYEITVFLSVGEELQRERILKRSPDLFECFINRWIPMENAYFENFGIKDICDYSFHNLFI